MRFIEAVQRLLCGKGPVSEFQRPLSSGIWIALLVAWSAMQSPKHDSKGSGKIECKLVQVNSPKEAATLQTPAKAHEVTEAVALVCSYTLEEDARKMSLASVGPKGRRQVREWPIVPLVQDEVPTTALVVASKVMVPKRTLTSLRVHVAKRFLDATTWASCAKDPGSYAKAQLKPFHSSSGWATHTAGPQRTERLSLKATSSRLLNGLSVRRASPAQLIGHGGCWPSES